MKTKTLIWIFVFAVLAAEALAIGLSPAEKSLEYTPNKAVDLTYYIVNNEKVEADIAVSAIGQLADFVKLEKSVVHISSSEELIPFNVRLTVPSELSPGENFVKIAISQIADSQSSGVQALIRISSKISINVPYPAGYVAPLPAVIKPGATQEDISILGFQRYFIQGKINEFPIEVQNNRDYQIGPVSSVISVQGIGDIRSPAYMLEPRQTISVISYWDLRNVTCGEYPAIISLEYVNFTITKPGKVFVINESEYNSITGKNLSELPIVSGSSAERQIPHLILIAGLLILLLINFVWFYYNKQNKEIEN